MTYVTRIFFVAMFTALLTIAFSTCVFAKYSDASVQVTETSTEGQNVIAAANFIRSMGQGSLADNILQWLRDGKIYYDRTLKENGDTGAYSKDITIGSSIIRNDNNQQARQTPFDPERDFDSIMMLARTLIHEKVHAHQNMFFIIWGNLPGKTDHELDAWCQTFNAMDDWLRALWQQYLDTPASNRSARLAILRKMERVASSKLTYMGDYTGDNNYFGGPREGWDEWKRLLERLHRRIREIIAQMDPQREESQNTEVGQVIREEKQAEQTTLANIPRLPRDNEVEVRYEGQGRASGYIMDLIIKNNTNREIWAEIPEGLVFIPSDPRVQRMILGEPVYVKVTPNSTTNRHLHGYCLDHPKLPPPLSGSGEKVTWTHPENFTPYIPNMQIIKTGNKLSKDGKYTGTFMKNTLQYKTTIIQRALWYYNTKGTDKEVGKQRLIDDMEKQLTALGDKAPPKEEREKVVNSIWDDIDLTLKTAANTSSSPTK